MSLLDDGRVFPERIFELPPVRSPRTLLTSPATLSPRARAATSRAPIQRTFVFTATKPEVRPNTTTPRVLPRRLPKAPLSSHSPTRRPPSEGLPAPPARDASRLRFSCASPQLLVEGEEEWTCNEDDGPPHPAGEAEEEEASRSSGMFDVAAVARLKRQQQRAQKGMRNHVVEEAQDDDRPTLTKRGAATTGVGWRTARARVKQSPRQWHRPVLRNNAPSWWLVPPHTASAADQFDVRHSSRSVRGERLLSRMHLDKASVPATRLPTPRAAEAFEEALFSVTSNRFVEPFVPHEERSNAKPPPRAGAVAPVERPWDLNDTLWKRRAAWCDGHGFFDSAKVKNAKMSKIFEGSLASGLAKYILKNDDGDSDDDDRYGQNGLNNDSSEVNDVRDEFGAYLDTFFGIFDVYAALDGDNLGRRD